MRPPTICFSVGVVDAGTGHVDVEPETEQHCVEEGVGFHAVAAAIRVVAWEVVSSGISCNEYLMRRDEYDSDL